MRQLKGHVFNLAIIQPIIRTVGHSINHRFSEPFRHASTHNGAPTMVHDSTRTIFHGTRFNRGLEGLNTFAQIAAAYEPVFEQARETVGPLFVWRTTTVMKRKDVLGGDGHLTWARLLTGMAHHYGWHILDAHAVAAKALHAGIDAFFDGLHYYSFMYEQLNDVLYNGIC